MIPGPTIEPVVLLADHTPPDTGFVNVTPEPTHTPDGPEINPTDGVVPIVTIAIADTDPQRFAAEC